MVFLDLISGETILLIWKRSKETEYAGLISGINKNTDGLRIMRPLNLRMGGGVKMSFTDLFYKHIMFREACGKCHFANTRRPSDITLGDFWGWEKTDPEINSDNKGVSLALINTKKGEELFEAVKKSMLVIPARLDDCLQPNLQSPSILDKRRKHFERDYKKRGFEYVLKKYTRDSLFHSCRFFARRVKRAIKKYIRL